MKKITGLVLIISAFLIGLSSFVPIPWFWQNRWERIEKKYSKDLEIFFATENGKRLKSELSKYEFFFPNPQVFNEVEAIEFPVATSEDGRIFLRIEVFRWIHENRYGYILQHEFFDGSSVDDEKIYEWSKTYEAGIYF